VIELGTSISARELLKDIQPDAPYVPFGCVHDRSFFRYACDLDLVGQPKEADESRTHAHRASDTAGGTQNELWQQMQSLLDNNVSLIPKRTYFALQISSQKLSLSSLIYRSLWNM